MVSKAYLRFVLFVTCIVTSAYSLAGNDYTFKVLPKQQTKGLISAMLSWDSGGDKKFSNDQFIWRDGGWANEYLLDAFSLNRLDIDISSTLTFEEDLIETERKFARSNIHYLFNRDKTKRCEVYLSLTWHKKSLRGHKSRLFANFLGCFDIKNPSD